MSNVALIIEERPTHIGSFMVGRLLPFREKRMVGPFAFIDHMGPALLKEFENIDIPPHPHIGLSTLTFLFEGSILHKDSLGTSLEIQPGAVNWMTAGRGIVHSERTPLHLRHSDKSLHGLQIWIALPKELEQMPPEFHHIPKEQIPTWYEGDTSFKVIAGEALGHKSPVPVHSPLYFIEIKTKTAKTITLGDQLYGESAMYILDGSISSDAHTYSPKQLLVAKDAKLCSFEMAENSTIYLFGGTPFPEERFIYWNFVATTKDLIEDAKRKWVLQDFDAVSGESDYVPLPS